MVGGGGLGGDCVVCVGASRVVDTEKESRLVGRLFLCGLLKGIGVVWCSARNGDARLGWG